MPTAAFTTWTVDHIKSVYDAYPQITRPVKLTASSTFAMGAIIAEKIGNNEVQTLTVDATSGTFTATFGGDTTSTVAYNARASALQSALEALDAIGAGNVAVTQPKRLFTLTNTDGSDAGTFKLRVTYGGESHVTSALTFDDVAADIDAAIEALPHLPDAAVTVSGSGGGPWTLTFANSLVGDVMVQVVEDSTTDGTVWEGGVQLTEGLHPYRIEFQNDLGYSNVAAITTDATGLSGGGGTATVATLTAGSAGTPGEYGAYDATATNGLQIPRGFLPVAVQTDANGLITYGNVSTGGEHGQKYTTTDGVFGGYYRTQDIPGLTMDILAALGGKIVSGKISSGVFTF